MDEMTGPGEDSQKHKSDDAAKYLAESFFGLNLNPADVGGEVLFDDYDDSRTVPLAGDSSAKTSADLDDSVAAFASAIAGRSSVTSPPNRFEENLDDLIVFSDDDDDEDDVQVDDEDEEDDDENFDFGDEDEDDEEDEDDLDEDEDFDEDDEEEEDDDELDDVDLDFGDDLMPPAPKKVVPVAQDSRGARSERSSAARDTQRSTPQHRGERSAERGARPQENSSARAESRASDRPPVAKSTDIGRKSAPSDDQYWNELDGWVWDDEAKKKPAAILPADDDDDDDGSENAETSPSSRAGEDEDAPKRKRGRRRGGRGRGRGRRDEKEPATSAPSASDSQRGSVDFDDDFSEIMFEEDQEDFVSVSAGSAKAQRRLQDEPTTAAARQHENEIDEEDDEDSIEATERVETEDNRAAGSRRGRRGRRGRGRAEAQEPARGDDRPAARAPRTIRNEDEIDDDVVDNDIELSEFSDQDDDEELPRRSRGPRTEQPPRSQGRGRGGSQRDPAPRSVESTDRPRRQPVKEPRSASADEPDNRRNPRPTRVAAEFQDIPTWEEAIGSLAIRTPTEEHARRAENRGRRDGGRPPRRKN